MARSKAEFQEYSFGKNATIHFDNIRDVCGGYDWQIDRSKFPNYDPRIMTTIIAKAASKHGLPFINLVDVFHVKECNELYYHHGNKHWAPRAQQLAATKVADRLGQEARLRDPLQSF